MHMSQCPQTNTINALLSHIHIKDILQGPLNTPSKVWDEIKYPNPNVKGRTVEVWIRYFM